MDVERLISADEFLNLAPASEGTLEELELGRVVQIPRPDFLAGQLAATICYHLATFVKRKRLGTVTARTGVRTGSNPDTVRAPAISYWSFERVPSGSKIVGYPEVAPDLCVEIPPIQSSGISYASRFSEYFDAGVHMVWLALPRDRSVVVYHSDGQAISMWDNELLDGEDVLPGFSCPVARFFEGSIGNE